jgi:hypothetical protein
VIVIAQQSLKNKILKKIFFFFFLVIISPPFLFGQEFIEDISFNVYRNESKIGYHKLNFKREEDRIIASIEIKFEVNFLGFTLYDYFHKNKEVWIADSLFKLKTNTNNNGDQLYCNVKKKAERFVIDGENNKIITKDEPLPSSYWKFDLVNNEKKRVLNTQDCSFIDFKIEFLGNEKIYEDQLEAMHYKLTGKEFNGDDVNIDIWYSNSKWVKMIFYKDESKIDYFLEKYDNK